MLTFSENEPEQKNLSGQCFFSWATVSSSSKLSLENPIQIFWSKLSVKVGVVVVSTCKCWNYQTLGAEFGCSWKLSFCLKHQKLYSFSQPCSKIHMLAWDLGSEESRVHFLPRGDDLVELMDLKQMDDRLMKRTRGADLLPALTSLEAKRIQVYKWRFGSDDLRSEIGCSKTI